MARRTHPDQTTVVTSRFEIQGPRNFQQNASIVLVGSRGAGKRTLGFIGATHLGRRLITEDHYFHEATGLTRKDYVCSEGNSEFYRRSVDVLKEMLGEHRTGCIIECGMASLAREAQRVLQEYAKTNPVIFITRDSERIRRLLHLGDTDALRLETADTAHRNCSNYEYYNLHDPSCDALPSQDGLSNAPSRLKYAKEDFTKFLELLTSQDTIRKRIESPFAISALPPECRSFTYALSLQSSTFPDLDTEQLEAVIDAVQLEIDVLTPEFHKTAAKQVAMIRRKLAVPVIFQVSETVLGDDESPAPERLKFYFELLNFGLRLGAEYVVVDLRCPLGYIDHLAQSSGSTKIVGHYMARLGAVEWHDDLWMRLYQKANLAGCATVRFVKATSEALDNLALQRVLRIFDCIPDRLPMITYNLGPYGQTSIIANRILTPVVPANPTSIATGNSGLLPTAAEAMEALYQSGVLNPLQFYSLGASVFWSLLPAMHSAAYQISGMTNNFQSLQVSSLDEIHRICREPNFGGAAITQPFKVQIMTRIAAKSYHAKAIGAVNTLLPLRVLPNGEHLNDSTQALFAHANNRCKSGPISAYFGDNTDYIGIMNCLRRAISPRNAVQPSKTTGLVVGAGGMARAAVYAMLQLGCRNVFMYNRTIEHAENVAEHFNSWAAGLSTGGKVVHVLGSRKDDWPVEYRLPTMIVSCVTARVIDDQPAANFEMPVRWLGSPTGGVVVELAYLPLNTPLLKQIRRFREETKQPWVIVDGLEVLPEQAVAQFELMTGRKAPRRRMRREVQENYHKYAQISD